MHVRVYFHISLRTNSCHKHNKCFKVLLCVHTSSFCLINNYTEVLFVKVLNIEFEGYIIKIVDLY